MKVIILGGAGQIGSLLYTGLKDVHEVVGTSRKGSDRYLQFHPFHDDWSALGTPDVLINCIGQIDVTPECGLHHIHVGVTEQILAHRQQLGNARIIQVSALGASPQHHVKFLKTKGIADDLLLQHRDAVVIRPSIVCTHRTMIVKKMISLLKLVRALGGVVPVPKGFLETKIQPIMPEDLVDLVHRMCVDGSERIIPAVGPDRLSFHEIIGIMIEARHRKVRLLEVPKRVSDVMVKHFVSRVFPRMINAQQYELLFEDNIADASVAAKLLDRPLKSTHDFFRKEFTYAAD